MILRPRPISPISPSLFLPRWYAKQAAREWLPEPRMAQHSHAASGVFDQGGVSLGPDDTTQYVELTIQSSQVDSALTDYVLYVNLANLPAGFWSGIQSDGRDIRVTNADGTVQYARDLVAIDAGGNTGEMYVRVPTVSSSADTVIRVYFNSGIATQPAASDPYGSEAVYRAAYKGVWHLDETSGQRNDHTSNDNHLTDNATVTSATPGLVGANASDFESGNSEFLSRSDASQVGLGNPSDITIEVVFKLETSTTQMLVAKWDTGNNATQEIQFYLTTTSAVIEYRQGTTSLTNISMSQTWSTGVWYHLWLSVDVSAKVGVWYVDGVNKTSTTSGSSTSTSIQNGSAQFRIGARTGVLTAYDGLMDEVRFSDEYLDGAYGKAAGVNMKTPLTFYSVGSVQSL